MADMKINVKIAEDHAVVRKGLMSVVQGYKRVGLVTEASNGKELLTQLREGDRPHVVIMDFDMPLVDGKNASEEILQKYPSIKILVLSSYDEPSIVLKMLEIGVHGYLVKRIQSQELEAAIYAVHDNDFYQNETTFLAMKDGVKMRGQRSGAKVGETISVREKEVLDCICKQLSINEIAERLGVTYKTVQNHRANLLAKTNAKNNVGLVLYALENGMLSSK
jgi:DNA-binding NarL/FixJ family response regulator